VKTALVLVGGEARRAKGREKYFFSFGGRTFLERLLTVLENLVDEILIVGKDTSQCEKFVHLDTIRCVADIEPGGGPVGGLRTGVLHARGDMLFVVACDMPCVQAAVVKRLFYLLGTYDAVVPCWDPERLEPLHAVYRRSALENYFREETSPSLRGVVHRLKTRYVPVQELTDLDPDLMTFTNINRLEDLESIGEEEGNECS
jgi:molybdopterin-guanine dinucleotide biosynthesis protein A